MGATDQRLPRAEEQYPRRPRLVSAGEARHRVALAENEHLGHHRAGMFLGAAGVGFHFQRAELRRGAFKFYRARDRTGNNGCGMYRAESAKIVVKSIAAMFYEVLSVSRAILATTGG